MYEKMLSMKEVGHPGSTDPKSGKRRAALP
jgi:hypothetical protein